MKSIIYTTGSLLFAGTIVGAGVLGLPFALALSGFWGGTLVLLVGALFAYLSSSYIAILVYQQKKEMPVQSIMEYYLGKKVGLLTLASVMFVSYGALTAYPLAIGEILSSLLNISFLEGALYFIVFMTILISFNLKDSSKINAIATIILSFLLLWVIFQSVPNINTINLSGFNSINLIQSWGVVIFAFGGHMVIPSVIYYLNSANNNNRIVGLNVVKWAILSVGILYFAFFLRNIGVLGNKVTSVATIGLGQALGPTITFIAQLFAFMAIITSFFGIAISLRLSFENQFKMTKFSSILLIIIPVVLIDLYLSNMGGDAFVMVLGYAGGIGTAIYAGIVPALAVIHLKNIYRFPLGMPGAYLCLFFYSLALIYTLFK